MAMQDIVDQLTKMNNDNDLGSDNLRPVIEYQVTDHYSKPMLAVASEMHSLGFDRQANQITRQVGLLKAGSKALTTELGRETVKKAQEIERGMVGYGRSGYKPTGNLMRSINVYETGKGTVQVYPDAKNKQGTEYGGFVEYGTRKHPTPEPFMYQANQEMNKRIKELTAGLLKGAGM